MRVFSHTYGRVCVILITERVSGGRAAAATLLGVVVVVVVVVIVIVVVVVVVVVVACAAALADNHVAACRRCRRHTIAAAHTQTAAQGTGGVTCSAARCATLQVSPGDSDARRRLVFDARLGFEAVEKRRKLVSGCYSVVHLLRQDLVRQGRDVDAQQDARETRGRASAALFAGDATACRVGRRCRSQSVNTNWVE
jgi:hypothetical protein